MKPTKLSEEQMQALADLLVLGMYADHNLTSAEEACVGRLLDTFVFSSDYERQRFCDAAFTRASSHANTPDSIRAYATQLAVRFSTKESRQSAYATLNDLLTSDGKVTEEESQLLAVLREAFQM
jgi:uncharacterized tellurite resistance protein B-like protein